MGKRKNNKDSSLEDYLSTIALLREGEYDAGAALRKKFSEPARIYSKRQFLDVTGERIQLLADNMIYLAKKDGFGYGIPLPAPIDFNRGALSVSLNSASRKPSFALAYDEISGLFEPIIEKARAANHGLRISLVGDAPSREAVELELDLPELAGRGNPDGSDNGRYDAFSVGVPDLRKTTFEESDFAPRRAPDAGDEGGLRHGHLQLVPSSSAEDGNSVARKSRARLRLVKPLASR
jgi:hypothetical protein